MRDILADPSVALPVLLLPLVPEPPAAAALEAYAAVSGVDPNGDWPTLPAISFHFRQYPRLMLSALRMHWPKSAAGCSSGLRVSGGTGENKYALTRQIEDASDNAPEAC